MERIERRNFMARIGGIAGLAALGSAMTSLPGSAVAQGRSISQQLTTPIEGTINGVPIKAGTLAINNFSARGNQLIATGVATLTDVNNVTRVFPLANIPAQIVQATCEILDLRLGPLDLNLLGLEIHLDEVHLNITANPAGGLLGQLLCAIANLFNGGSPLQQIIGLLNQLIALLR
jgi:hypothetical protein